VYLPARFVVSMLATPRCEARRRNDSRWGDGMNSELAVRRSDAALRFATDDVAPGDRLAVWREVLGRVHLHLDVEQAADGPLHATVESYRLGPASLYFSNTTAVRASRTRELVQDGDGDFRLLFSRGAGYEYSANGADHIVGDGHAALLFNGVVSSVRYLGSCRVTAVRVRRDDLAIAIRNLNEQPIRYVDPRSSAFHLLADYAEVLRRQGPASDPVLAARIAAHLTDLVALAVGDGRAVIDARSVPVARLAAIKAKIESHLGEHDLSAERIGAQHGVTGRYVRMLFEGDGTSFSDFVLERRLLRARDLLSDPRLFERTIGSIAYDAGFGDLSHFNRNFRRRFGSTPGDVRENARREFHG
jgi:AraC-like DNA-binding protein